MSKPLMCGWCVLVALVVLLAGGFWQARAQETEDHSARHAAGHEEYSGWASAKTSNCCNNQDCEFLNGDDWRERQTGVEVRVGVVWCPVRQEHYIIRGKSPDWTKAHACINKNPIAEFSNVCDRLLCFAGTPKY